MTPNLEELRALLDLLREKRVAHFEAGDLKILLAPEEGEEECDEDDDGED